MRKWYHIDTGNPQLKEKLCRHLRGQRLIHECVDLKLHYDFWRVRVLITDRCELDEVNRWLAAN